MKGSMFSGPQIFTYTLNDLERMMVGMGSGIKYNYQAKEAEHGEPTLSMEQLLNILGDKSTSNSTQQTYTLMVEGKRDIKQKKQHENNDQVPTTLRIEKHNILQDVWTMPEVKEEGVSKEHRVIETRVTDHSLNNEKINLRTNEISKSIPNIHTLSFTFEDIQRMITGVKSGKQYNYKGIPASPGEPTIPKQWLLDIQKSPRFIGSLHRPTELFTLTIESTQKMLPDTASGIHSTLQFDDTQSIQRSRTNDDIKSSFDNQLNSTTIVKPSLLENQHGHNHFDDIPYEKVMEEINAMVTQVNNGQTSIHGERITEPVSQTNTKDQLKVMQYIFDVIRNSSNKHQTEQLTSEDIERFIGEIENDKQYNSTKLIVLFDWLWKLFQTQTSSNKNVENLANALKNQTAQSFGQTDSIDWIALLLQFIRAGGYFLLILLSNF
ncbi:hypothetical protein ACF0H5_018184 [Mactra antiquata]